MKKSKLKIILATIISMILIILITSVAFSNKIYSASGAIELDRLIKDKKYYYISFAHLINYDNVYCIQKGQSFPRQLKPMTLKYRLWLEGSTGYAQLHKYKGPDEHHFEYDYQETDNSGFVNLMAAILCESDMGLGYGSNTGAYTNSQKALYYYWDQFLSKTGLDAYMKGSGSNASIASDGNINNIIDKYKEYASQKSYEVNIYYFVSASGNLQRLILVQRLGEEEKSIDIPVKKEWNDGNNKYNTRSDITVELLANGDSTGNTLTLNQSNNWEGKFTDLKPNDDDGKEIQYKIKEIEAPEGYTSSTLGNMENGFTITNTLLTEVKVVKQWNDENDLDEYRPDSLKVTLCVDGLSTGKTVTLSDENDWTATFENLNKYDKNGKEINYTVQEETVENYEKPVYEETEDSKGYITYTITNTHTPHYDGYIEISGKVWVDMPDGKGNNIDGVYVDQDTDKDSKDVLKEGVTVRLKYIDDDGNAKLFNSDYPDVYETKTDSNGEYTIRVNYDNTKNVYKLYEDVATVNKKLETAYVEFEYDGMLYTTVANADTGANTSKATENESARNTFDSNHSTVTSSTTHPDKWTDKDIIAVTKTVTSYEKDDDENREVVIKYCNGNGTYIRTNPDGAWKDILPGTNDLACNSGGGHDLMTYGITVQKIPNINLGLFEREQPDVAIFSDLTKVEVTMNNQKYTYLYGVRGDESNDVGLQAKFQNKGTYTYRRPVNPADIAYIQEEAHSNAMSVLVTYEIKVGNLSSTLPITVHNITNYFDTRYTLNTEGWTVIPGTEFNKATYSGDLNITVDPQTESSPIELTYTVSVDAIRALLNEEATLNNAVEIESFSTSYGELTLYAEQRTGGRAGQPYAGYDYNSHPGNAGIFINGDGRLEAAKPEDDTDIAPSFVLCLDDSKTLAGTVWEDADENLSDDERLGDGFQDATEKNAENVKVELFNIDGTTTKLYNKETKQLDRDAVVYTESDGNYKLDGVVTGEYYIKFTYGDDTTKLEHEATTMDGGTTTVNARNYKSTIITDETIKNVLSKDYESFTEEEKKWHITHTDGYSVAVDNMKERLEIEDLYYENFTDSLNMTSYTKPFKTQVEFEATGQSKVDAEGNIADVTETLDRLDFGIAERPREDLFAQKTITYFKITLANGQVLTEGNPSNPDANINYAKPMGFAQEINSGEDARNALEKQLLVEMDSELIQGAQLEVEYAVTITNNNELDYDYGILEDYESEFEEASKREYDKYITKNSKASYYYYGNPGELAPMSVTIEFIDYLSNDIVYKDNGNWKNVDVASELYVENNKLISDATNDSLSTNKYQVFRSASGKSVTIPRGTSTGPLYMITSKVLTNKDENVYDNSVEILNIDGKTARTIQKSDGGTQVKKTYEPGNYIPSSTSDITEQDDDRVKIIITPPTGLTSDITTYVITALLELMVVFVGIVYIKKKRLIK